jgi:hypothetical protein
VKVIENIFKNSSHSPSSIKITIKDTGMLPLENVVIGSSYPTNIGRLLISWVIDRALEFTR